MKNMKNTKAVRTLALILAAVLLLPALIACNGNESVTTTSGTEATTTTTTALPPSGGDEPVEDPYLYLTVDGEAQYVIVNPTNGVTENLQAAQSFAAELEEITGASFRSITDGYLPETDKEIMVAAYRNRESVQSIFEEVSYTEYRVALDGDRIVLATYAEYVPRMLEYILEEMFELEEGTWVLDRAVMDFSRDLYTNSAIPHYDTAAGTVGGNLVYRGRYDSLTVAIEKTNRAEYDAYLAKLESLGYTRYAENAIGEVIFHTYTKGNEALHVQLSPGAALKGTTAKMTMTKNETLPATSAAAYTAKTDSKVINLARVVGQGGWGMSMIFQLADGSFIIADGALNTSGDQSALIKLIKDNTPKGQTPTISLWLWTHAHGDHVDLCRNSLRKFKSEGIDIKAYGHNFPDWTVQAGIDDGGGNYYSTQMIAEMQYSFPNAVEWVMHAGQKMYIADAVIECYWTHEDVFPSLHLFSTLNDSCSVFSITIDGVKTMILGDCQTPNSKMVYHYKDALRSPLVQNSHHSGNGPRSMYEYIDPLYSFWACAKDEMNDAWRSQDHCNYLRETQWTRTDADGNTVQGNRKHFNNSETAILLIKDLKAEFEGLK